MSHENDNRVDSFIKLGLEMNLVQTPADSAVGGVIGRAALTYGLEANRCAQLLRAIVEIIKEQEGVLFMSAIVDAYTQAYDDPREAAAFLGRVADYYSRCASVEEAEMIVAKMTQPKQEG